jgi:peroxiredoxin Q/BCP
MNIGNTIPDFTLPDQHGNPFSIAQALGKKYLVLYFYPKDNTPGCTKEACTFRDSLKEFESLDAKVIGISSDSVASHQAFAKKYQLNFTLLSDSGKKVRKLLEVPSDIFGLLDGRVTYVIDKEGIIRHIFKSQLNASKHVEEAKKVLTKL